MKASETKLRFVLEGQKQFQIPLFQRPYSWKRKHWETLWNDVWETYNSPDSQPHFLGPIVTKSLPGTPEGISPYLVIDGQQRLTTLSVLLAAIRDAAADDHPEISDKISDLYLRNQYVDGIKAYKVLPTQVDRASYRLLIDNPGTYASDAIGKAYRYFKRRIGQQVEEENGEPIDLSRLEMTVLSDLELVSITLEEADNEYRIFESLNYTGEPLSQADLIRNHFFMKLPEHHQQAAYDEVWLPMQEALGDSLADYFRTQLQAQGSFVREADIYELWKRRLANMEVEQLLDELQRLRHESAFFLGLIEPDHESSETVRDALRRIQRWRGSTVFPFLLNVYRRFAAEDISAHDFAKVLHILESFMIRRFFVGVPTNQLNRLFIRLYPQLDQGLPLVEATRKALSDPGKRWPDDEEVVRAVESFELYKNGKPDQRRLVLETLLLSDGHKEPIEIDDLTIEHIMPRTLNSAWKEQLGSEGQLQHRRLVHTVGNLTLTGYNPELSNSPFSKKRELLAASNLPVNREIAQLHSWGIEDIKDRNRRLAKQCTSRWTGPVRLEE